MCLDIKLPSMGKFWSGKNLAIFYLPIISLSNLVKLATEIMKQLHFNLLNASYNTYYSAIAILPVHTA